MRQVVKGLGKAGKYASTQSSMQYSRSIPKVFNGSIIPKQMSYNDVTQSFMTTTHSTRQYTTQIRQRIQNDTNAASIKQDDQFITVKFNHVGRDKHQDEDANAGTAYENPWYEYLLSVWNSLEKPGDVEIGGQEYGAAIEKARISPADNLSKVARNTPNARKRSLGRGAYVNAVYALHPNDAKECYIYIKRYGADAFIKLFDYNVNWEEMEDVIDIISNIFEYFEFALPHSPDSNKEFQTLKSEEIAIRLERILNDPTNTVTKVEASIKRMVKGMTKSEAVEAVDIMAPKLLARGINYITLHAHGESASAACAAFIARCSEYGINVGVDVVPEVEEGEAAFPTIDRITNILLEEYGIDIKPKGEDKQKLEEVARIQTIIDKSLESVKVKMADYWSESDMRFMGMPSGGARFLFDDIMRSGIFTSLNLNPANQDHIKQACQIVKYTYKKTRNDAGKINSVTPGHKRVGDIAIKLTCNIAIDIKNYASSLNKTVVELSDEDLNSFYAADLQTLSKHKLYHGISPEVVDALRNGAGDKQVYPELFLEDFKDFICREHMENTLKQIIFKYLPAEIKAALIENSRSKERVVEIMEQYLASNEGKDFLVKAHMSEMLEQEPFKGLHHAIKKELLENTSNESKGQEILLNYIESVEISKEASEEDLANITQVYDNLSSLYYTTALRDRILTKSSKVYDSYDIEGAAGEREYTEASKAKELGPDMEADLIESGYSGDNLFKKKVEGILSKTFFHANLDKAAAPNPHGISKENFKKMLALDSMSLDQRLQQSTGAFAMGGAISATNPDGFNVDPNSLDFKYDPTGEHAERCAEFLERQSWANAVASTTAEVQNFTGK